MNPELLAEWARWIAEALADELVERVEDEEATEPEPRARSRQERAQAT